MRGEFLKPSLGVGFVLDVARGNDGQLHHAGELFACKFFFSPIKIQHSKLVVMAWGVGIQRDRFLQCLLSIFVRPFRKPTEEDRCKLTFNPTQSPKCTMKGTED